MKIRHSRNGKLCVFGSVWIIAVIGLVAMLTGSVAQSVWTQTTQADFDNATMMIDVDTSISPGNVSLAPSIADWTKGQGNPVLGLGSATDWNSEATGKSSVMKTETGYRMWFGGWDGTISSVGIAESQDGLTWSEFDSNPVLTPDAAWEGSSVEMVHVIEVNGEYNMWYSSGSKIGFAESFDGVIWTKDSGNPVLTAGQPGEWDDSGVRDPTVLYENGVFRMWYAGYDGSDYRLGYAESNDGRTWTKSLLNPVLDPSPATWDSRFVWDPFVLNLTGTLHMWYMGSDTSYLDGQIGYATSPDGVNWIKHPSNPVLAFGAAGSWEDREVGGPFVIVEDGTFKMWYTGHDGSSSRIGYAVSIGGHTSAGIFESEVFDSGSLGTSWESLNWTGSVPSQTSIAFSVRTGDTDQPDTSWSSWSAESTVNDIPTQMPRTGKIQYRAVLTSSVVDAAPVLEDVRIYYTLNQESPPTPQSPTEADEVTSPMFSWIHDDPEGDAQAAFIVEVDDSVDFSSIDYSSGEVDSSDTDWVPDETISAGEWYWRVRTMDEYGLWSGNSNPISFTVTEPDSSFIEDWWWVIIVLALVTALVLIILLYSRKREEEAPQEVHETEEREPPMETQQREMEMTDEERLEKLEKRHEEGNISDETYEELKGRYGGESDRTE